MTKKELLEASILGSAKQAGVEASGRIHLTSRSRDSGALFIMEVMQPDRKRVCEEARRAITETQPANDSGCIALIPEAVDGIVFAAQAGLAGFHPDNR
jgi:hypothetical protein